MNMIKKYKFLSNLENEILKNNEILIDKFKDMLEYPVFAQIYNSRKPEVIQENGYGGVLLTIWFAFSDRSYSESLNYFHLMTSVLP